MMRRRWFLFWKRLTGTRLWLSGDDILSTVLFDNLSRLPSKTKAGHDGPHVHRCGAAKSVEFVWAWMVLITKLPEGFTVFRIFEDPRSDGGNQQHSLFDILFITLWATCGPGQGLGSWQLQDLLPSSQHRRHRQPPPNVAFSSGIKTHRASTTVTWVRSLTRTVARL